MHALKLGLGVEDMARMGISEREARLTIKLLRKTGELRRIYARYRAIKNRLSAPPVAIGATGHITRKKTR